MISRGLGAPMMHFIPLSKGSKVMEGEIDNIVVYYPVRSLYQSIEVLNPDILLVHSASTNLCREIKEIKKVCPTVAYVCHANVYELLITDAIRQYFDYMLFLLDNCDLVISVSESQKQILEMLTDNKIVTIPPAIEYDKLKNIEATPRDFEFIMCGRLVSIKNQLTPIIAMKELSKKYPNAFLKIFGSGVLERFYRKLVGQLKLEDNVGIFGNVSHNDIISEMCYSTALISSSFYENNSVSVLEATALGVPVVNQIKYSPYGLYLHLCDVIENYDDFKKIANIKRKDVKHCDVKVVVREYERHLKKLL